MNITRKSFFIDRVKAHRLIDHDDLIDELEEHFGCKVASRSLIPEMLQNTEVYYDRNFDRCFASKDLFYQMLEEEETE